MKSLVFPGKVLMEVFMCPFKKVHKEFTKFVIQTLSKLGLKSFLSVSPLFLTNCSELCSEITGLCFMEQPHKYEVCLGEYSTGYLHSVSTWS